MSAEGRNSGGATPPPPAGGAAPPSAGADSGPAPPGPAAPVAQNGANAKPPAAPLTGVTFYYLSQVLRRRVRFEGETKPFGRVHDLGAGFTTPYPLTVCLEVRSTRRNAAFQAAPDAGRMPALRGAVIVPWSAVVSFTPREIVVRKEFGPPPQVNFWLRDGVLDGQVVDVSGAKAVRVNDIHLLYAEGRLVVGHVEVGFLGILRRLRVERAVCWLVRWLLGYTFEDRFVSWRHVQLILPGGPQGELRVSAAPVRLAEIHPAELAEIMEELGVKERQTFFSSLPIETAAEALEAVEPELQRTMISQEEPGKAADILEEMPAHEAADVLRDLHVPDALRIISRMENGAAKDIRALLAHEEETAGALMSTSYIAARPTDHAGAVLGRLRAVADEVQIFNYIYVLDDAQHLVGVVSLRDILRADPEATIEGLTTTHLVQVEPDASVRDVGRLFLKYGLRALPVVDKEGLFLGAVRLKGILNELAPLVRE